MKIKLIYITGLIFFIAAIILSEGYLHPDEHFQLLEFANYKMGGIPAEHLPWEFDEAMRPTFQVFIVYGLCTFMKSAGIFDPYLASMLLRLFTGACMFYLLHLFVKRYKNEVQTEKGIWWLTALTFLLWYVPFISVRYSSEALSTIFMLAALLVYHRQGDKKINGGLALLTGLLLGLCFITRFQMGFMIFGLGLWVLFIQREKFSMILLMLLGIIISVGIGQVCDYWFYGKWVSSAYNYFYQNLVENKAASFGVSPFWYYASMTPLLVFPLLGIIIVPVFIAFFIKYPKHIFTWILVPFLLIHHVIGHKELRFLLPVTPFIPFIVVIILEKIKWLHRISWMKYVFWGINIPALIIMSIKPAYDNMGMFKYIYRQQASSEIYYLDTFSPFMRYQYEFEKRPFIKGKDLKITFFHRPDFNPHPVHGIEGLISVADTSSKPVYFVVSTIPYEKGYRQQLVNAGLHPKVVYHTYHNWLKPVNFNNWLNREDVGAWSVVELKK